MIENARQSYHHLQQSPVPRKDIQRIMNRNNIAVFS
jgi:hypothetical protein